MQFKQGVVLERMHISMLAAHDTIDRVFQRIAGRQAMCTAARDGKHKPGSLHYDGRAEDFRTNDITDNAKVPQIKDELKRELGAAFDVLLEDEGTPNEHIHVEYDPKD